MKQHREALEILADAGIVSFHWLVYLNIYEKHEAILRSGSTKPIQEISKLFKYTRHHIMKVLRRLNERI